MADTVWQRSILKRIGTRSEIMAELFPRVYLLLTTGFAVTGYLSLLLFPLLVLAGMAGMYHALAGSPDIAWIRLLAWALVTGLCGMISYRIFQFRPALPAGVELERRQAPALFQLVADTAEHYSCPRIDRIVVTGVYQLDVVSTPRTAVPLWSTRTLVIGLPLMHCLSTTRFSCLLARRLGQCSRRTGPLLNWLYELRQVWPRYQLAAGGTGPVLLLMQRLFSIYAPLYAAVSTAAARLDELQADSYAMELFNDEEVLDAITTDTVYRLFLRERYWPAIRKLRAQDATAITKSHAGMVKVLRAGVQERSISQWVEQAMSMEQPWYDPWPLLMRRLENIGHAQAHMAADTSDSAALEYLKQHVPELEAALEYVQAPGYPRLPRRTAELTGLQRLLHSAMHRLPRGRRHTPQPGDHAGELGN